MKNRQTTFLILTGIIILAFVLRMYKITNPLADWHSFRQADTASVTREYLKRGIDLLHPKYHDLSNIQSGKDNPVGYRMVEFPIINAFSAIVIMLLSGQTHQVIIERILSVIASLGTIFGIYLIGKEVSGRKVALIASLLFAILPFSVYYSRVILPEPFLLVISVFAIYFNLKSLNSGSRLAIVLSSILFSISILIKPYVVFLLPVFIYVPIKNKNLKQFIAVTLSILISTLPFILWRLWIKNYPEGLPASDWLFNKDNIRFKPAFFNWLIQVRLASLILGSFGILPFLLGLFRKGKDHLFYLAYLISISLYLIVIAGGNVQHDYYQVLLLPFVCLTSARGLQAIIDLPVQQFGRSSKYLLVGVVVLASVFFSFYQIKEYYHINNPVIVEAGMAVDQMTPQNSKVIAPYNGDTAFLFQTNRTGWPIGYYIDQKINLGADYYITVNFDNEANELEKIYKTIKRTDQYLLLDLKQKK